MFRVIASHCKDFATQKQLLLLGDSLIFSRANKQLCLHDDIIFISYDRPFDKNIIEMIIYGDKSFEIDYGKYIIIFTFYENNSIKSKYGYHYNGQKYIYYHENGNKKSEG